MVLFLLTLQMTVCTFIFVLLEEQGLCVKKIYVEKRQLPTVMFVFKLGHRYCFDPVFFFPVKGSFDSLFQFLWVFSI